jgi:hypothetical protein
VSGAKLLPDHQGALGNGADRVVLSASNRCQGSSNRDQQRPMRKSITRIFSRRQKNRGVGKQTRSCSVDSIDQPDHLGMADEDDPPLINSELIVIEQRTARPLPETPSCELLGKMHEDMTSRSRENTPPPRIVVPTRLVDDDDTGDEIEDTIQMMKAYDAVPALEETKLPRGGVSVETKAIGRIQVRKSHQINEVSTHRIHSSLVYRQKPSKTV